MYKVTESKLNEIINLLNSFNKINTDRIDNKQLLTFKVKALKLSNSIKKEYTKIKPLYAK